MSNPIIVENIIKLLTIYIALSPVVFMYASMSDRDLEKDPLFGVSFLDVKFFTPGLLIFFVVSCAIGLKNILYSWGTAEGTAKTVFGGWGGLALGLKYLKWFKEEISEKNHR